MSIIHKYIMHSVQKKMREFAGAIMMLFVFMGDN